MSLGGGRDRTWMKPLLPNARSQDPEFGEMIGTSDGPMASYAIINPKPGCEYTYERMDGEALVRVRSQGGRFVRQDDTTKTVFTQLAESGEFVMSGKASPMDGTQNNGEIVLVEWPPEAARRKHEQEQKRALAIARGGAEDFVTKASPAERAASRLPTRFRRADHALHSEDGAGAVVDSWQPESGIIREG